MNDVYRSDDNGLGQAIAGLFVLAAVALAILIGATAFVLLHAFKWGHDRKWTPYPNLDGLLAAIGLAGLWASLSEIVGYVAHQGTEFWGYLGNGFISLNISLLAVALAIGTLLLVTRFVMWIFTREGEETPNPIGWITNLAKSLNPLRRVY